MAETGGGGNQNRVFTAIFELLTKGSLSGIKEAGKDVETFIGKSEGLKKTAKDIASAGQIVADGFMDVMNVWEEQYQVTAKAMDDIVGKGESVGDRIKAFGSVLKTSVVADFKILGVTASTITKLFSVDFVAALTAGFVAFRTFHSILKTFNTALVNAATISIEFNNNLVKVRQTMISSGQVAGEMYEHLGGQIAQRMYKEASSGFIGLTNALSGFGAVASTSGSIILGTISKMIGTFGNLIGLGADGWLDKLGNRLRKLASDTNAWLLELNDTDAVRKRLLDVDLSVKGITESLHDMEKRTGVSFGVLLNKFNALKNTTGNSVAAMSSLKTAMEIAAKSGYANVEELIDVIGNLSSGIDVSDAILRKFGVDTSNFGEGVATTTEKLELFINNLVKMGRISAEDSKILLNNLKTNESIVQSEQRKLDNLRALHKATVEDEYTTAKKLAAIRTGDTQQDLARQTNYLNARIRLLENFNATELNLLRTSIRAKQAIYGGSFTDLQRANKIQQDFINAQLKSLSTTPDLQKKFAAEALDTARNIYESQTEFAKNAFNKQTSMQIESLDTIRALGLKNTKEVGSDMIGVERERLHILNSQITAFEHYNKIVKKGSNEHLDNLRQILNLSVNELDTIRQRREALVGLLHSVLNTTLAINKVRGATVIDLMRNEVEVFNRRKALIENEMKLYDKNSVKRKQLQLELAQLSVQTLENLGNNARQIGQTILGIYQRNLIEARRAAIAENNILASLEKRRLDITRPSPYLQYQLQTAGPGAGQTLASIEAFKQFAQISDKFKGLGEQMKNVAAGKGDVSELAAKLRPILAESSDATRGIINQILESTWNVVAQDIAKDITGMKDPTQKLIETMDKTTKDLDENINKLLRIEVELIEKIGLLLPNIENTISNLQPLQTFIARINETYSDFNKQYTLLQKFIPSIPDILNESSIALYTKNISNSLEHIKAELTKTAPNLDVKALREKYQTFNIEEFTKRYETHLKREFEENRPTDVTKARESIRNAFESAIEYFDTIKASVDMQDPRIKQAFENITNKLIDSLKIPVSYGGTDIGHAIKSSLSEQFNNLTSEYGTIITRLSQNLKNKVEQKTQEYLNKFDENISKTQTESTNIIKQQLTNMVNDVSKMQLPKLTPPQPSQSQTPQQVLSISKTPFQIQLVRETVPSQPPQPSPQPAPSPPSVPPLQPPSLPPQLMSTLLNIPSIFESMLSTLNSISENIQKFSIFTTKNDSSSRTVNIKVQENAASLLEKLFAEFLRQGLVTQTLIPKMRSNEG